MIARLMIQRRIAERIAGALLGALRLGRPVERRFRPRARRVGSR